LDVLAIAAMLILVLHRAAQQGGGLGGGNRLQIRSREKGFLRAAGVFLERSRRERPLPRRHARSRDATRHRAAVQSSIVDTTAAMIFRLPIARKRVPFAKDSHCLEFVQRLL
jgi:hypothetical protein